MPRLSSPWYQQKRSDSAQSSPRPKDPPTMSLQEQQQLTTRLSRPTESALQRRAVYCKCDSFMDQGRHSWTKMPLFEDCKKCMWTPSGTIKSGSCKIRPIQVHRSEPGPAPGQ